MWRIHAHSARITLPALLLGILILGSAAVSAPSDTAGACPIGGYTINACPMITDAVIRDQIVSRLSGSVASSRYPIVVTVCGGVVTLRGQVLNMGKKDLASIFAYSVRGVTCVQNQLTLDPTVIDDLILVGEVRKALNRSAVDSKRVRVDISDGVVQLSGMTASEIDKESAAQTVAGVPGVTTVYNNITVQEGYSGTPF